MVRNWLRGVHLAGLSLAALAMLAVSLVLAPAARASTFAVTTTADVVDGSDGVLSLREAISSANANAGDDTVVLAAGATYELTAGCDSAAEQSNISGSLDHTDTAGGLVIEGSGSTIRGVIGCTADEVLYTDGSSLELRGVTITGGQGGGIRRGPSATGPTVLIDSHVDGNGRSESWTHGGISAAADGPVRLTRSTVDGNLGSGIDWQDGSYRGDVEMVDSSVSHNTRDGLGTRSSDATFQRSHVDSNGGFGLISTGVLSMIDATISGNGSAGVMASGTVTMLRSAVNGNGIGPVASFPLGLIAYRATLVDSTVDGNRSGGLFVGGYRDSQPPSATLIRSSASRNGGPGVWAGVPGDGDPAVVSITDSRVDANEIGVQAAEWGGPAQTTIERSSVSNNSMHDSTLNLSDGAAGVFVEGSLVLRDSRVEANTSDLTDVGGVKVTGSTTIEGSVISGNETTKPGATIGGLALRDGSLGITGSTISGNVGGTGGVETLAAEPAVMSNSTVTGNTGTSGTGGASMGGPGAVRDSIRFSTIAGNAGVLADDLSTHLDGSGSLSSVGSAVGSPSSPADDCSGGTALVSGGGNVSSDRSCGFGAVSGDLAGAGDLGLGPLAGNGGTTSTRAPSPSSPVLDRVAVGSPACPVADQRGVARPQGTGCDAGAVEVAKGGYHPMVPVRALDTRDGTGGLGTTPLGPGETRVLALAGFEAAAGIDPAGVSAIEANVTVTGTTAASHLTVWDAGSVLPGSSNLNWVPGTTIANLVTTRIGPAGIAIRNNSGSAHVVVDIEGWYDTGITAGPAAASSVPVAVVACPCGDAWYGVTPARLLDTRNGIGGLGSTPMGPDETRELAVAGAGGVPADADAVIVNLTVVGTTAASHLSAWPAGQVLPPVSNINWPAGATLANLAIVKVGNGGRIALRNNAGNAHVVVDVAGYFVAGSGPRFVPRSPTRIGDTRTGRGFVPVDAVYALDVVTTGGVPAGAAGVALNVTAVGPRGPGFLSVSPSPATLRRSSNINFVAGQTIPNQVITLSGLLLFGSPVRVDVLADLAGWYS